MQSRNLSKEQTNLYQVKSTFTRLLLVIIIWSTFFSFYELKNLEKPSCFLAIWILMAVYLVLELVVLIMRIRSIDESSKFINLLHQKKKGVF